MRDDLPRTRMLIVQGKGREGKRRKHYEHMSHKALIMHRWKLVLCHL